MAAKIPKIVLSADEAQRLVRQLEDWRQEAVAHREGSQELKDVYWRLYRAEPDQAEKQWPWPKASNLFIPLAQSTINTIQGQIYDSVAANEPLLDVQAVDNLDGTVQDAFQLTDYYDGFLYKTVIPFRELFNDAVLDMCVDGTTCFKPSWDRSLKVCRETTQEARRETSTVKVNILGVDSEIEDQRIVGYDTVERAYVRRVDKAAIDVPDMARIFYLADTGASLQWPDCKAYFEQCWLNYNDLLDRRRAAGWRFSEDRVKGALKEREISERERTEREREGRDETVDSEVLEVCEFYFRWALPARFQLRYDPTDPFQIGEGAKSGEAPAEYSENGEQAAKEKEVEQDAGEDGYPEEVICWYAPDLKDDADSNYGIMRLVPLERIYPDGQRPHHLDFYDRIPRSPQGMGVSSALRYLNEWMNSSANQMVDQGTLRNIPFFLYSPVSAGLMADMVGIRPGAGIPVMDPRGVVFPRFQGDNSTWINSLQMAQAWGEKVSHVTDYTQGRAPSTPNAPRTARMGIAMMQAAMISYNRLISLIVQPIIRVMSQIHSLHSKWAINDTKFRRYNQGTRRYENAFISNSTFKREAEFRIIVNPSRQQQLQTALQIMQNLGPILERVNPDGMRLMWKDILQLSASHFSREFDQLWPPMPVQGPPQPPMGGPQGPPQPPQPGLAPPMGPPGMPEPVGGMGNIDVGGG